MLDKYSEKRDFEVSPEPPPEVGAPTGPLVFCVQKHDARRLHYDLRLECGGVLLSWAVPKGPSLNIEDKRLAVMVEDHPFDYRTFEGQIPKGEYGGGQVIVWDEGTYSPDDKGVFSWHDRDEAQRRVREDLAAGKLSFYLRGHKLKGSFALVKVKRAENEWLLIKHKDEFVTDKDVLLQDRSVRSNLTVEEIRAGKVPESSRADPFVEAEPAPGAKRAGLPSRVPPMLATIAPEAFCDPEWLFELKFDGIRAIAILHRGLVKLISRGDRDVGYKFPNLRDQLAMLTMDTLVLDGEVVTFDQKGRPSFERMMSRFHLEREADLRMADKSNPVSFCVFDLLYKNGWDLRGVPLRERRAILDSLELTQGRVQVVEAFPEDGQTFYRAAIGLGLEGIMAKRLNGKYESGCRSANWLKIKGFHSEEFFVGGYTQGEGSRAFTFGSLILGRYDEDKLVYVGNVGSGFDDAGLLSMLRRLDPLITDQCPFAEPPEPAVSKTATWTTPEVAVEVRFASWTETTMRLREPVFQRLRPDIGPPGASVQEAFQEDVATEPEAATGAERDAMSDAIEQLKTRKRDIILSVEGHRVSVSNLDKTLWPAAEGFEAYTKRDLLRYFAAISPWLLDHLRERPLTFARYPEGIDGEYFYQKHWEHELPPFVTSVNIFSEHHRKSGEYMVCDNLATLLWLAQIADIELHSWYSRIGPEPDGHHLGLDFSSSLYGLESSLLNYPDFMVIDLDPYIYSGKEKPGAEPELDRDAYKKTCEIALTIKDTLDALTLPSYLKTSGKTGLHIYVPITRRFDYDQVRAMAQTIGLHILRQRPKEVTMDWSVPKRTGKIFFDHNQNARGKTLASVYSPRAALGAPVSTPLDWSEIFDVYPTQFNLKTTPERVAAIGDLWTDILRNKHDLAMLSPETPYEKNADN